MTIDSSFLIAFASVGLLAGLVALVLAKRLVRGAAERGSRLRREGWMKALGSGAVSDMRMGELRALASAAARRRPAQEDLLALISAGRLPPRDERRVPFERAVIRGGLQRSLARPARAAQRGHPRPVSRRSCGPGSASWEPSGPSRG